jgi:hypothetical protein
MGSGVIMTTNYTNALPIHELIRDDIKQDNLNLMQNQAFTYKEYATLIKSMVE